MKTHENLFMILFSYVRPVCFRQKAYFQTIVQTENDCDWNYISFYLLENGSLWDIIFGYLIKTQLSSAALKNSALRRLDNEWY